MAPSDCTAPEEVDSRQKAPCSRIMTTTGGIVMGKRKYAHVKELEPAILQMRKEGKTRREIAEHLGLTMKRVKSWINRYNRKQRKRYRKIGAPQTFAWAQNEAKLVQTMKNTPVIGGVFRLLTRSKISKSDVKTWYGCSYRILQKIQ